MAVETQAAQLVGPVTSPRPGSVRQAWRSFKWATWLGWVSESNWTDPWLFFIYALAKPISSALIVLVMYTVVARADVTSPLFAYLYVGNAFFQYVFQTSSGMAWVVLDDREWNRTLKFVWMSPVHIGWYFVGRSMAKVLVATLSVLVLLVFGWLVLGVKLNTVGWGYGLTAFAIGLAACVAVGLLLSGTLLLLANKGDYVSEGVGGLIYLLAGAVFPIDVLPAWVRPISLGLPHTYWLEGIRRGFVGGESMSPFLAQFSDGQVMLRLAAITAIWVTVSLLWFTYCRRRVAQLGLVDMVTMH